MPALAVSYSLADPPGKRGTEREKGDTRLLSLREKVSCPLLSCPLLSPIAVSSVVFLAITRIYATSLRGF
jgi:hypothetical protein